MELGVMMVSAITFVVLGFVLVGGPMLVVERSRKRGRTVIERQVALTDALDGQLGPIVAPVVMKPVFDPWEVQIVLPFRRSAVLALILSAVDDVFAGVEGGNGPSYRIVVSAKQNLLTEAGGCHGHERGLRSEGSETPSAPAEAAGSPQCPPRDLKREQGSYAVA